LFKIYLILRQFFNRQSADVRYIILMCECMCMKVDSMSELDNWVDCRL